MGLRIALPEQRTIPSIVGMPRGTVPDQPDYIGRTLSNLGATIGGVVEQQQQNEEKRLANEKRLQEEQQKLDHEAAMSWVAEQTALTRETWNERMQAMQTDAPEGAPGFLDRFKSEFDAYKENLVGQAPSLLAKKMMGQKLLELKTQYGHDAIRYGSHASALQSAAQLMRGMNAGAGSVVTAPWTAGKVLQEQLAAIDQRSGLDEQSKTKLRDAARDKITTAALSGELTHAREDDRALAHLQDRMDQGEFEGASPNSIAAISGRIVGYRASLQAKAEAETRRRQAAAERIGRENEAYWKQAVDLVGAGKNVSPEFLGTLTRRFAGTAYAGGLKALLQESPKTQAFAAQPLTVQEQSLQGMLTEGNTRGWNPEQQKRYDALSRGFANTRREAQDDPINAALERGVIAQAPTPLDLANSQTIGAQIAARTELLNTVSAWTGRQESPLTASEAKQIAGVIEAQPVESRAHWLGAISRAVGEPGRMRSLSAQMGAKNPTLATAGMMAASNLKTPEGRSVAEMYLKGDEAMKQGTAKIDQAKEIGIKASIYKAINGVYATPQATDAAADASLRVYAALKAEGSDSVDKAIRIATGGIIEWNGQKVAKPYGWDDASFRDAVKTITPAAVLFASDGDVLVGDKRMTPDEFAAQIPRAQLKSAGDGAYAVIVGSNVARRANGRPLILTLRRRDVR